MSRKKQQPFSLQKSSTHFNILMTGCLKDIRDAVWGWGPNRYFLLQRSVFTSLSISLRNKENPYFFYPLNCFYHLWNLLNHLSSYGTGVFLKSSSKVTFASIFLSSISTVGTNGTAPFSRSLRNLKKFLTICHILVSSSFLRWQWRKVEFSVPGEHEPKDSEADLSKESCLFGKFCSSLFSNRLINGGSGHLVF